jgi:ankyrin repeat protein
MAAWQERIHSAAVVEILLKSKADPNIRNSLGATPLHHAAQARAAPLPAWVRWNPR